MAKGTKVNKTANKAANVNKEVEEAAENVKTTEETPVTEEATNAEAINAEADEAAEATETVEGTVEENTGDKKDTEIAELKERITRNLAEFDNFRKRTEREKSQMFDLGARSMIEKLLPVIDNFERGLATLDEEGLKEPFAAGIEKTYKQLQTALTEAGVTPIEAVGKEFNPDLHNAVMHVEDENFGENIVCEEFQKGYMYRDMVVRHSMVKVAN